LDACGWDSCKGVGVGGTRAAWCGEVWCGPQVLVLVGLLGFRV
jgi:hypothetical protein